VNLEIFRHGEALYRQDYVSWGEARDLTENGRRVVEVNARKYLDNPGSDRAIIISSPYGRTLETASIIARHLESIGVECLVRIRKCLQEQKYSYSLLKTLADGGEIEINVVNMIL